jgi:hypothetical protein
MKSFWVLGKFFKDDHDRAIRYIGTTDAMRAIKRDVPKDSKVGPEWCEKCQIFHIVRTETTNTSQ